jgi:fatty-acyl-CoA synthase
MRQTALSYDHGTSAAKLLGETIGDALDRTVAAHGDRTALIVRHQGVRWTWRELAQRADAIAAGLLALGLDRGDRVGIWAPNCAEWTQLQLATARAGMILVNINPAYRRAELAYALHKVGCKALVLAPALKTSDYLAILGDLVPELASSVAGELRAAALPELRAVVRLGEARTPGMLNFDELAARGGDAERARLAELAASLQFDDPINIQFTSGTTGHPKGATLTHRNILNNGFFVGEAIRLTHEDRVCIPVPLYHCFGMVMGNLACLTHGAAMVYPSEAFDPTAVLDAIQTERCTALYGVPTMFIAELEHARFGEFDVASLRTGSWPGRRARSR